MGCSTRVRSRDDWVSEGWSVGAFGEGSSWLHVRAGRPWTRLEGSHTLDSRFQCMREYTITAASIIYTLNSKFPLYQHRGRNSLFSSSVERSCSLRCVISLEPSQTACGPFSTPLSSHHMSILHAPRHHRTATPCCRYRSQQTAHYGYT